MCGYFELVHRLCPQNTKIWSFFHLLSTSIDFNQLGNLSWRVNSRIYVTFETYLAKNDALRGYVVMANRSQQGVALVIRI